MASFERHIGPLIESEGGYKLTNHPNDRGGRTFAGISQKWHPDWEGWKMLEAGVSPAAIEDAVHRFYRAEYWTPIQGDALVNDDVAEVMLSCAVLSGVGTCIGLAQMTTGAKVDQIMGPNTLAAVNGMDARLFEATFALMRINRFRVIANRDKTQRVNFRGWVNRVFEELES